MYFTFLAGSMLPRVSAVAAQGCMRKVQFRLCYFLPLTDMPTLQLAQHVWLVSVRSIYHMVVSLYASKAKADKGADA